MYKNLLKRLLDIIISLTLILIASPVILAVMLILKLINKHSVFITIEKIGKNKRVFKTIYFNVYDNKADTLNKNNKKTKIGGLLHNNNLNLIMILFNIIKGDMSFIGPMPLTLDQIDNIDKNEKTRFEVLPGITGLAQLEFGNNINYIDSIIEYDNIYVKKASLLLDIVIIIKTLCLFMKKFYNSVENKYFYLLLKNKKNLIIEGNISVRKAPIIDIRRGSKIVLKNNVTLNSRNKGHHVNMYSKVKLLTDRPNAKIIIGENTRINGSCIHSREKITIGRNCLIAANCQIIDCNGHDVCPNDPSQRIHTTGSTKPIIIGDNVWIGTGCIILPGVSIGNGCIIGAGSIVTKSILDNTLAAGNPAKSIKKIKL